MQFKDVQTNRFVAVAVDGEVKEYGGGKLLISSNIAFLEEHA